MANFKLVVEVVNAEEAVPFNRQGPMNTCVELNFDDQQYHTSIKENDRNPVWNERFYFDVSDPAKLPALDLEAAVFHVESSGSTIYLGEVRINGALILPISHGVICNRYKLGSPGSKSLRKFRGKLFLKVYITGSLNHPSLESELHDQSSGPHGIPLEFLKQITDNFSDERIIGNGGSSVVYKGVLQNGATIVVKKIVSSFMPYLQTQFENEVFHLMEAKHDNIVRCLGYCYEIKYECSKQNGKYIFAEVAERLLCLEYFPIGSLDKLISGGRYSQFGWTTRYKIIDGVCHGLCYLHEKNVKPMLHLDLKPANILLDYGMIPKIADLGLSRQLDQQQTIYTNSRDGTLGYMAPEFLHKGTITTKSDIFGLGVIILEIVTGHRDYPDITRTSSNGFIEHELDIWKSVFQKEAKHECLETDCKQIKRCLEVGLICVNPDRTKRPPIKNVIHMLQGS